MSCICDTMDTDKYEHFFYANMNGTGVSDRALVVLYRSST